MPSKKRKYNARFPAGRIKKIMQTDEEVGKVAQAVPIIIYLALSPRTLELFVESLLSKAMQVTLSRNAKTLSPSHVKQCILAESRFDFLRDLVKNIPDVSAAEEKEMMSAENSPNSSRYSDTSAPPRRIAREDSNSSSGSDMRVQQPPGRERLKRGRSAEAERRTETATSATADVAIDLSKRPDERPVRTANFYQETLVTEEAQQQQQQHRSVITPNPTYATPQPSTSATTSATASGYPRKTTIEALKKVIIPVPKGEPKSYHHATHPSAALVSPLLNIDFSKNLGKPEIEVLVGDTAVASIVGAPKPERTARGQRRSSRAQRAEAKPEPKLEYSPPAPVDIDHLNSGNLQIDEDYDT